MCEGFRVHIIKIEEIAIPQADDEKKNGQVIHLFNWQWSTIKFKIKKRKSIFGIKADIIFADIFVFDDLILFYQRKHF